MNGSLQKYWYRTLGYSVSAAAFALVLAGNAQAQVQYYPFVAPKNTGIAPGFELATTPYANRDYPYPQPGQFDPPSLQAPLAYGQMAAVPSAQAPYAAARPQAEVAQASKKAFKTESSFYNIKQIATAAEAAPSAIKGSREMAMGRMPFFFPGESTSRTVLASSLPVALAQAVQKPVAGQVARNESAILPVVQAENAPKAPAFLSPFVSPQRVPGLTVASQEKTVSRHVSTVAENAAKRNATLRLAQEQVHQKQMALLFSQGAMSASQVPLDAASHAGAGVVRPQPPLEPPAVHVAAVAIRPHTYEPTSIHTLPWLVSDVPRSDVAKAHSAAQPSAMVIASNAAPLPWLAHATQTSKSIAVAADVRAPTPAVHQERTALLSYNVQAAADAAVPVQTTALGTLPPASKDTYVFAAPVSRPNLAALAPSAGTSSPSATPAQPLLTLPTASGPAPFVAPAAAPAPSSQITVAPLASPATSATVVPFTAPLEPPIASDHGISTESQRIVDALPPERPRHQKLPPVTVSHFHKNAMESDQEIKKHDGVGIKITVEQPKEDISKMLEDAYDDLIAGNQEEAIGLYKDVLAREPQNKLALFGLATTYHRAGQLQLARPLYGRLLAIDPHNVEGLNNFLVLLADEAPREALVELERLEQSHPGFSPIPAQMAIIYEKLNNFPMAVQKMQQAIDMSPENIKYQYDMAVMLDKRGDWPDAAMYYQQLLVASERGEKIPASEEDIQERLTFIRSNRSGE